MGWVVKAMLWPLYPREEPGIHCIRGWVGPRTGLDGCGNSRPPPVFDHRTVQPVASRYTDSLRPTSEKIWQVQISLWFLQHAALKVERWLWWLWWCGGSVRKCYKICRETLCLSAGFYHTYILRDTLSTYVIGKVMGKLITKPDILNLM